MMKKIVVGMLNRKKGKIVTWKSDFCVIKIAQPVAILKLITGMMMPTHLFLLFDRALCLNDRANAMIKA